MSKTVDDLGQIFDAAYRANTYGIMTEVHAKATRAGIRAVVEALRDEIESLPAERCRHREDINFLFYQILAPREGGQAAGGPNSNAGLSVFKSTAPAAPALVCEWTGISEMGDIVHYTTKHGVTNDLNMWRRDKTCAFCNLPIKFTEAK